VSPGYFELQIFSNIMFKKLSNFALFLKTNYDNINNFYMNNSVFLK
jgi:hypothetical protein